MISLASPAPVLSHQGKGKTFGYNPILFVHGNVELI
jgi:hypothetical protein